MFSVRCIGQDVPQNVPILSGVTFGFMDLELVFMLNASPMEEPLRISFYAIDNKEKKQFEFEIGNIKNNRMDLKFHNPSENGTSGLNMPISILAFGNDLLGFMFHLERLSNSKCYKLNYEFYHGRIDIKGGS